MNVKSVAALSAVMLSTSPAILGQSADRKIINSYYAQWTVYDGYLIKTIDTSGTAKHLDILTYAFANIGTNTKGQYECTSYDSWADNGTGAGATPNTSVGGKGLPSNGLTGNFGQLLLLKQAYPNLKIVITIGGASLPPQAFSAMAATKASRKHFAGSCISDYIKGHFTGAFGQTPNKWEHGVSVQGPPGPPVPDTPGLFDGIEIDWEFPAADDTANFTALIKEFRNQLDAVKKGAYLLSYDAPAGEQNFSNINIAAVDPYVSYIDLMTYDYAGPWQNQTGFVAPLYSTKYDPDPTLNVNYSVNAYLAAGACPRKILLGIPFYGYGWSVAPNAPNPDGQFDPATPLSMSTENYNYIKTTLEPNMQVFQDRATNGGITKTPWLFDGTNFWTYDDAESVYQKMEYARIKGLGGAFAWELSGDLPDGHLEKTIYAGLSGLPLY